MYFFSIIPSTYADSPIGPFDWRQGEAAKTLLSSTDHVCVLTKVAGNFRGGGESVLLSNTDDKWHLSGTSKQDGVSATAYCFNHKSFAGDGADYWNSEQFQVSSPERKCNAKGQETWWGDAATYLAGVSGEFEGGGESIDVNQSSEGFVPSVLSVQSCRKTRQMKGTAYAFFVGKAHAGHSGRFWGPNGVGSANFAGEYQVVSKGNATVEMAPVEQAMCYFTQIRGGFFGSGEFAKIEPAKNNKGQYVWMLSSQAKNGGGVYAKARCFRRDQTCGAAGCKDERLSNPGNNPNPGNPPPPESKPYNFCVIPSGSGAGAHDQVVHATSYPEAEAKLRELNANMAPGWSYSLGECPRSVR